ncbi:MAG: 50S ribosomal protein L29 [Planctomycetota bacterium]|jgi:large subunit ribosomal protein L29|nr:50S ribosomal protein L29 [Blastopirellula sp.]
MNERENTANYLRGLSDEQLAAQAKDAANTLFRLRVQSQTDRLDVPSEIRRNRRLIARIKTISNERKRGQ